MAAAQPTPARTPIASVGQLMAQATGQPAIPIYHDSETRFVYRVVDAQIEFQLDDAGLVVGLTLFQGGKEMPAKKME